jgi:phosphoglycolate phosphatase-like HAD superfamily hydrolase
MSDERHDVVVTDNTAPRWIGIVVVVLAVISITGLAIGWTASNHTKALDQSFSTQTQTDKTNEDVLAQRLSKAEDTNAQLQGELSVVTDKMKLTQGELNRARAQATKIKADDAKQMATLQSSMSDMNGQIATKASVDDMNKIGTDVTGVKTDLETTKNNLNMTRGEFGTLIAKNHDEVEELRRLGERDYFEFTINKKNDREKVGNLMVELHSTNTKKSQYTVTIFVDDQRHDKKGLSANEPLYFFQNGARSPLEFVVNQVGKNKITGYLSVPKTSPTQASTSTNSSGN